MMARLCCFAGSMGEVRRGVSVGCSESCEPQPSKHSWECWCHTSPTKIPHSFETQVAFWHGLTFLDMAVLLSTFADTKRR